MHADVESPQRNRRLEEVTVRDGQSDLKIGGLPEGGAETVSFAPQPERCGEIGDDRYVPKGGCAARRNGGRMPPLLIWRVASERRGSPFLVDAEVLRLVGATQLRRCAVLPGGIPWSFQ